MPLTVTSTGNAGVRLEAGGKRLYIDSFFRAVPDVGGAPLLRGGDAAPADLILVTHSHFDHFNPDETRDAALASGGTVAGPSSVVKALAGLLPPERLVTLEPAERKNPPDSVSRDIAGIAVTAFRTYHSRGHNSYLIEFAGRRVLHDGDNERTQPFDPAALGRLDALFLCPWAGSGAGEFVQALSPAKWFLVHMTPDEIRDHRAGAFLPGLIEQVPPGVLALEPGETVEIQ